MAKRWITWTGGECPVPPETIVEVRLKKGDGYNINSKDKASRYNWESGDEFYYPIIAYRIVEDLPNKESENEKRK